MSETTERLHLPFGYNGPHLDGLRAAWGARLIVHQREGADFVHDRQGAAGEPDARAELLAKLQEDFPPTALVDRVTELLRSHQIGTRIAAEVELFRNARLVVIGNSNASAGYFYVAAWLKVHAS